MGSKSKAPDYSQFLNSTKELGQQYLGFAQEQFRTANDRYQAMLPYQQRLMDNQSALMAGQLDAQALAMDQAKDNYEYNKNTFRPLEEKMIGLATSWNTDAERERMASQAGANVQQALDNQRSQSVRALERLGVSPSSGRMMQLLSGTGLQGAAMQAQAQNTATMQARDQGFQRLAGVTGMGRGLSAQSIAAINAGSGAAQAGSGAASVGQGAMGSADRVGQMYTQNGLTGLGGYGSSITSGANITNMGFQNEMAANQANNQLWSGVGSAAGMMFSSKKMKTEKEGVSEDAILKKVQALPVESWRYNNSAQRHVGPYAEDVKKSFGDDVAPGGMMLDMASMNGINLAATKALASKVDRLESMLSGSRMATGGLVRGPGTGTSDSVPAVNQDDGSPIRLSNGEYVLPAETVRKIGISKLDKIVEKTNGKPPVHRRKALEA